MDLAVWLRSLGLEQYEATFRDNAITEKLLPSLTAEDLKDLGVSVVGHRRALLSAIADLRSDANATQAPSAALETRSAPPKDTAAERRQVTVMFSDLVGSTALSARIDPEDLREIISAYQKCVAETVRSFGGFVANYMGDGVLVYFGYPKAHEDDVETPECQFCPPGRRRSRFSAISTLRLRTPTRHSRTRAPSVTPLR
jgi:class 3 adenylate cyclase